MTPRSPLGKWLSYGAALLAVAIVNYYVLALFPIPLPLLPLMAAVAAGTLEGPAFGAGFGMAAGFVMATLGHAGLLCIPGVTAAGLVCGLLALYLLRQDFWGHLVCALIVILFWELYLVGVRFAGGAGLSPLLRIAGPELLCTLLCSIPVYFLERFCCRRYGRMYYGSSF